MKTKLLLSTLFISLLTPAVSHAFGSRYTWVSGYAQGTAEYTILGKGQSQLYLACDSSGEQPERLIFTDGSGRQVTTDNNQRILVTIDQEEAADVSETASHVGSGNFTWMWEKLRTGKRVTVSGDGVSPATFTLVGADKALPEYARSSCIPEFSR
ncbi:TPA: hypothetical protein ACPY5O_003936 [Yersinia enterocolitica]|uniref:hypothetical protein n=1 Tax=Yersinia intermedia TaxID=631 RepID=UPI0005E023C0|nr:hypothetical protein [Yersinia intermedia]EKN4708877.1 hypothetical protein [Yersinia enterocolitica]EKN6146944.1 hypothetical protein [Yersinia enterocolitica]CNI09343.1 Uncharacterised protein [Yersinia intermedia]